MLRSLLPNCRSRAHVEPGLLVLLVIALVALLGCSGSAATAVGDGNGEQRGPVPPAGFATAAPTAAPSAAQVAIGAPVGGGTTGSSVAADPQAGPLIVRTGSLALEVADIDATLLQARARIVGLGGYVSDSERANSGDSSTALITYRIPAARWDEALDALHGFAKKVVAEQTRAVDVTGQVLDLGARIDNLRATERALQTIMAQATRITDILDVQNQLTDVQGQIEQLSTQKAHLGEQAALGTLAVTYTLPVAAVAHVNSSWSLSAEFDRAVAQLLGLGQGLAVLGVWLGVVGLPIVFGLLLLAGLIVFTARRLGFARPTARPGAGLPTAHA